MDAKMVEQMKIRLIESMNIDVYASLDEGEICLNGMKELIDSFDRSKSKNKELEGILKEDNLKKWNKYTQTFNDMSEEEREVMEGLLVLSYERYIKKLKENKCNLNIEYLCGSVHLNIYIIDSESKMLRINGGTIVNKENPSVIMLNKDNKYIPVFKMEEKSNIYIFTEEEMEQIY
jgi:hypothetical protein